MLGKDIKARVISTGQGYSWLRGKYVPRGRFWYGRRGYKRDDIVLIPANESKGQADMIFDQYCVPVDEADKEYLKAIGIYK